MSHIRATTNYFRIKYNVTDCVVGVTALGCVGIVSACVRPWLYSYDSGADLAFGSWYWNMTPCSLVGWCQGLEEFTASIFRDKKRLVICLAMVLRGFAVWYQHFRHPYWL